MRFASLCIFLLATCLGCCAGLVQVFPTANTVYVLEGTRLVLQCTTRSDQAEHVDWLVRSDSVTDQRFKLVTTVEEHGSVKTTNVTAIKEHAVLADTDTYLCIAGNIQRTKNVEVFQVRVQNASIQRGKHSELRCDPRSAADEKEWTITWHHNGRPLEEVLGMHGRYRFYDKNTTLIIRSPTEADAGLYECQLTIGRGKPHAQHFVVQAELNGPPFVPLDVPINSVLELEPHDQVNVYCPVRGYPEPYVTWWYQRQQVRQCEHMWTDSHIGMPQRKLHVHDFWCQEAGVYTCMGRNAYGQANKSFTFYCNAASALGLGPGGAGLLAVTWLAWAVLVLLPSPLC